MAGGPVVVRSVAGNARLVAARSSLRRLLAAWGLGVGVEWAVLVLLSVACYERGGAAAVGIMGVARVVPGALATPATSALLDRYPRARVLCLAVLASAVLVALTPVALAAATLLPVYVLVGVWSAVWSVFRPAVNGLVPQVVEQPEELAAANSLYSFLEAAGTLLGPLAAAALLGGLPEWAGYEILAAVAVLPAVLVAGLRTHTRPAARPPASLLRRLLEPLAGFPALAATVPTRALLVVFEAQCVMRGLLNVFVVAAAVTVLGVGEAGTGPLFAALGVGGLLGAAAAMPLAGSGRLAAPFVGGMVLWGLPIVIMALWPRPAVAWCALAVVGTGNAIVDVTGFTIFHRLIPDHLLGRAFGALWGSAAAGVAVGSLAAAPLIEQLGLRPAMTVTGAVMAVLPLLLWPLLRRVDTEVSVDEDRIALLRRLPLFASLSRLSLEHLARRATPVEVDAGQPVVRQGEEGDRFYAIEAGELVARVDGVEVSSMSAGDGFGEIALLHRTRRTATVVAATPARLAAIDGGVFVAAVTSNVGAESVALALASERLTRGAPARDPG
jgi:MFS family permease